MPPLANRLDQLPSTGTPGLAPTEAPVPDVLLLSLSLLRSSSLHFLSSLLLYFFPPTPPHSPSPVSFSSSLSFCLFSLPCLSSSVSVPLWSLPFMCPFLMCLSMPPFSQTMASPSASLCLFLFSLPFFSSVLSPWSTRLSLPACPSATPTLLPPSLSCLSPSSLPRLASSVSLSPCLSLPQLSGKAAVIYELRTGPAAGAGGPDYSFPEEAACLGMAG